MKYRVQLFFYLRCGHVMWSLFYDSFSASGTQTFVVKYIFRRKFLNDLVPLVEPSSEVMKW